MTVKVESNLVPRVSLLPFPWGERGKRRRETLGTRMGSKMIKKKNLCRCSNCQLNLRISDHLFALYILICMLSFCFYRPRSAKHSDNCSNIGLAMLAIQILACKMIMVIDSILFFF